MPTCRDFMSAATDLLLGGTCVGCQCPGPALCPGCGSQLEQVPFEARPSPRPRGLPTSFATASYDGAAQAALLAHKEQGRLTLSGPLGRALALSVLAVLARVEGPLSTPVVLVPPPSASATVRARGHDPVRRIGAACVRSLRGAGVGALLINALRQTRRVGDQAGLTADQRAGNLRGAFAVKPAERRIADAHTVAIDDIVTTGSTAVEMARALRGAGADVLGVAVVAATQRHARVADGGRG